jgi:glyoxylase-like metal-dependent hydrolase (beta-lactamase superfamily II)
VPLPPVERFQSDTGVRIYRISCQAFPTLVAHTYLLLGAGPPTLVDTGSGYGDSTPQLLDGITEVRERFGEPIGARDIRRILITHGHHDHFGGLVQMEDPIAAEVGIHELDRWVLTGYEERVVVATHAIRVFLRSAGVSPEKEQRLLEMYRSTKRGLKSVRVGFTLGHGQELDGLRFIHVPGHCPGQVAIRIGDVLLTADHVLPGTTPHQSPESITASTGLRHYLESLDRIGTEEGVRLCLGGHEQPFADLPGRVAAIRGHHARKLDRILATLRERPLTTDQLTTLIYPDVSGWDVLLAVEEIGAHVEYLYQRGDLVAVNYQEIAREENPAIQFGLR